MSLPTGQYKIISLVGNPIGRHPIEDRSFNPKRIVALPKYLVEPRIWQIDHIADGKYKLRTGGAVVGTLHGNHVWAFLLEGDIEGAEWRITHVPQHGDNAYIIETADKNTGWVAIEGGTPQSQVAVKHLRPTDSLPPQYPPTEVFNIFDVSD